MRRIPFHSTLLIFLALMTLSAGGCLFGGGDELSPAEEVKTDSRRRNLLSRRKLRPPINTTRNLYEGSMWRGASSWGNLLRDHRARFRGDLLTVTDLQKIIKVPEIKPETQVEQVEQLAQQAAQQEQEVIDPILAFLRERARLRELVDAEQNEILRSIDSIEVEVIGVRSNGNLVVRGVHPPIFRERNRVKYIVSLTGLVRPSDVDENNIVSSTKLNKAEYKIRRLVRRATLPLGSLARAGGRPKEGEFLDRFSNLVTGPRE
jgi:flagellar basal body L-ring protein FlgH